MVCLMKTKPWQILLKQPGDIEYGVNDGGHSINHIQPRQRREPNNMTEKKARACVCVCAMRYHRIVLCIREYINVFLADTDAERIVCGDENKSDMIQANKRARLPQCTTKYTTHFINRKRK